MTAPITRRAALGRLVGVGVGLIAAAPVRAQTARPLLVYKDPNCGCCHQWVGHMKANGFAPTVKDTADVNTVKRAHNVAQPLWSCHTAIVGNYVIEGHVPASDVKRLLTEQPKGIVGLTIPGMPASAPGMDVKPFQPFTVLSFDVQGRTKVWAEHRQG